MQELLSKTLMNLLVALINLVGGLAMVSTLQEGVRGALEPRDGDHRTPLNGPKGDELLVHFPSASWMLLAYWSNHTSRAEQRAKIKRTDEHFCAMPSTSRAPISAAQLALTWLMMAAS